METAADADAPSAPPEDALAAASTAFEQALRFAKAAVDLLRAEFRLARSSVMALVWLAFALVFFGVGAWLALSAAIAAGVYQLTGNVFYGIAIVAIANVIGVVLVLRSMRGCWHDLGLPRTRGVLHQIRHGSQ
ncbi:MAG: hypothetical protein ABJB02_07660 [Dokdonella sp.]